MGTLGVGDVVRGVDARRSRRPSRVTAVAATVMMVAASLVIATSPAGAGDSDPPTWTVPGDITVGTDPGLTTAVVTYLEPMATDNVGVVSSSCTATSGDTFPLGTNTVICTASDAAGNVGDASFMVTVEDDEAPTWSLPADITVETDPGLPTAMVFFVATAADNVGLLSESCDATSGDAFPLGTTTVMCTATDTAGNIGTDSFTVTVEDLEAPALIVGPDITVGTDPGLSTAVVVFDDPLATDNVAVTSESCDATSGDAFPLGTTTVTCMASDAAGNITSGFFTITVLRVISAGATSVVEGTGGTTVVSVPVTLSVPAPAEGVTVDWETVGAGGTPGLATEDVDFLAAGGTLTFAEGEDSKMLTITVISDDIDEPELGFGGEWGLIALSDPSPNAVIDTSVFFGLGIFVIVDDDPPPVVSAGSGVVVEGTDPGGGGATLLSIPVSLSTESEFPVMVDVSTVFSAGWDTATAAIPGVDYVSISSVPLLFAPGVTELTVEVPVVGDSLTEFDELVVISLSGATNATIGGYFGLGFGSILDDDDPE